jgi:hypothetical protein
MHNTIFVWQFHDAPDQYKALSRHGGDEDWLAFVPASLFGTYISWIEGGRFGICDVEEYEVNGGTVYIGAHA